MEVNSCGENNFVLNNGKLNKHVVSYYRAKKNGGHKVCAPKYPSHCQIRFLKRCNRKNYFYFKVCIYLTPERRYEKHVLVKEDRPSWPTIGLSGGSTVSVSPSVTALSSVALDTAYIVALSSACLRPCKMPFWSSCLKPSSYGRSCGAS